MLPAPIILDEERPLRGVVHCIGCDRHLSVATRNVEHVGRLAESRDAAAQTAHERLTLFDTNPQMRRAGREIGMMQIVRFDASFDERAH